MNIKKYKRTLLLLLLALAAGVTNYGQEANNDKSKKESAEIQNLIDSKKFVFVAQSVLPMGRRTINLTSAYSLEVSGDTVISDLPYFGRAFVAPINPSEAGFRFTSTQFDYNVKERKKGGWDIAIVPKDANDVRQMLLNISESGYGSLQVLSNNRQQISYNGYIKERKEKS